MCLMVPRIWNLVIVEEKQGKKCTESEAILWKSLTDLECEV